MMCFGGNEQFLEFLERKCDHALFYVFLAWRTIAVHIGLQLQLGDLWKWRWAGRITTTVPDDDVVWAPGFPCCKLPINTHGCVRFNANGVTNCGNDIELYAICETKRFKS